jgi:hypothetical protein
MHPHKLTLSLLVCLISITPVLAQKTKAPHGGRVAVVVDERLAAVRATPRLNGKLVRRLGRGRLVAIRAVKTDPDGIVFYLVNVTSRTYGWIQREAVLSASLPGDDQKLLQLIKSSTEFDRISRARIFLDHFRHSPLSPEVLLLLGDAAEQACEHLSRDAARRVGARTLAPEFSYFMNYAGLDRYNRQGVTFVFERSQKRFHYDGSAWRQILQRYPTSQQVAEARKRLDRSTVLAR